MSEGPPLDRLPPTRRPRRAIECEYPHEVAGRCAGCGTVVRGRAASGALSGAQRPRYGANTCDEYYDEYDEPDPYSALFDHYDEHDDTRPWPVSAATVGYECERVGFIERVRRLVKGRGL